MTSYFQAEQTNALTLAAATMESVARHVTLDLEAYCRSSAASVETNVEALETDLHLRLPMSWLDEYHDFLCEWTEIGLGVG